MPDINSITWTPLDKIPKPVNWINQYDQNSSWIESFPQLSKIGNEWLFADWDRRHRHIDEMFRSLNLRGNLTRESNNSVFGLGDAVYIPTIGNLLDLENAGSDINSPTRTLYLVIRNGFPAANYFHDYLIYIQDELQDIDRQQALSKPCFRLLINALSAGTEGWLASLLNLTKQEQFILFQTDLMVNHNFRMGDHPFFEENFKRLGSTGFLAGPIWNCSLDYLYKLAFGIWVIIPVINEAYNDNILRLKLRTVAILLKTLLVNIKKQNDLFYNPNSDQRYDPTHGNSTVDKNIKSIISEMLFNDRQKFEQHIDVILPLVNAVISSEPSDPQFEEINGQRQTFLDHRLRDPNAEDPLED